LSGRAKSGAVLPEEERELSRSDSGPPGQEPGVVGSLDGMGILLSFSSYSSYLLRCSGLTPIPAALLELPAALLGYPAALLELLRLRRHGFRV
jgi:hypothetical protein